MVIGIEITVKFLNKFISDFYGHIIYFLFGFLRHFQHFTDHITMGSFVGRGNQYIQLVKVLYCKLPTSGKQLATLPHKVQGLNSQPQRWEASMLPLDCHGPLMDMLYKVGNVSFFKPCQFISYIKCDVTGFNVCCNSICVGAQLRSQPILRWAIAQLRIRSWVAHLKMG